MGTSLHLHPEVIYGVRARPPCVKPSSLVNPLRAYRPTARRADKIHGPYVRAERRLGRILPGRGGWTLVQNKLTFQAPDTLSGCSPRVPGEKSSSSAMDFSFAHWC